MSNEEAAPQEQWAIQSPTLTFQGRVVQQGGYLPDENGKIMLIGSYEEAAMAAAGAGLLYGRPFVPAPWPPDDGIPT